MAGRMVVRRLCLYVKKLRSVEIVCELDFYHGCRHADQHADYDDGGVCAVEKGFKGTAVLHVSGSVYDDVYRRNYSDLHRCKGSASDEFAVGDDPAVGGQHLQPDYFKKLLLGASDGAGGSGASGRMYGDRRIV